MVKYYLQSIYGFRIETTKEDYYSKRRRKGARELISYNNGRRSMRILKDWQKK